MGNPANDLRVPERIAHALFLPEGEDEEPIVVASFSVERDLPDGTRESAGRLIRADEVADGEALVRRWGGGVYHLKARDSKGRMIPGGWRTHRFDADAFPPRPLVEVPSGISGQSGAAHAPPPVARSVQRAPATVAPVLDPTLAFVAGLMQQQQQSTMQFANAMIQQQQQHGKELLEVVTKGFEAVSNARAGGALDADAKLEAYLAGEERGLSKAEELAEHAASKGSGDPIEEAIAQAAGGFMAAKAAQQGSGGG